MAFKQVPVIQNLRDTDIWYCEAGDSHIYLGVVEKEDGTQRFVRVIARDLEQAYEEIGRSGEILVIASLREIISDFMVVSHAGERAQVH
jgi:hypothetical protein